MKETDREYVAGASAELARLRAEQGIERLLDGIYHACLEWIEKGREPELDPARLQEAARRGLDALVRRCREAMATKGLAPAEVDRRMGWPAGRTEQVLGRPAELRHGEEMRLADVLGFRLDRCFGEAARRAGAAPVESLEEKLDGIERSIELIGRLGSELAESPSAARELQDAAARWPLIFAAAQAAGSRRSAPRRHEPQPPRHGSDQDLAFWGRIASTGFDQSGGRLIISLILRANCDAPNGLARKSRRSSFRPCLPITSPV